MDRADLSGGPIVVVFAGHDPTGGAGILADAEAITTLGARAATLITALTVQDSHRVRRFEPVAARLLDDCARTLLADFTPAVFKIGMIGSEANVRVIANMLALFPTVPVVLDPVLTAGGGGTLSDASLIDSLKHLLLPRTTVLTPNGPELRALVPDTDSMADAAGVLLSVGCANVLVTGGHEPGPEVVCRLYASGHETIQYATPRLPGEFHGSGCTFASAIAALLAHKTELADAVKEALAYTRQSLLQARRPGTGQALPDRHFRIAPYRLAGPPGD